MDLQIFKYEDGKKIVGDARLARGLIIARAGKDSEPFFFNMPMHKFDELTNF